MEGLSSFAYSGGQLFTGVHCSWSVYWGLFDKEGKRETEENEHADLFSQL
jgi:hypothetical protein